MNEIEKTLYYRELSNPREFEIQFATKFRSKKGYAYNGWQIVQSPTSANDTLKINLVFKAGNDHEVIHEVPIGTFPNNISNWKLEINYLDENGIKIKEKGNTEQAEATANPKPVKTFNA